MSKRSHLLHSPPAQPFDSLHACCSEKEKQATDGLFEGENTGINFDAYEDIPVEVRSPI